MLTVSGVSAGYGRVPVLHDVALSVGPCEVVALLGANGAGKTTLLRVIAGELRPSAGSVDFSGRGLVGRRPERVVAAGVALVPEGRRMFAGLTVRENLLLGGYSRRRADLAADLDRIYGLFPRLGQRAERAAGRLSGGEQQMVAIGRALMGRPRLLMIDELSQGLAPTIVDDLIDLRRPAGGAGRPSGAGGGGAGLRAGAGIDRAGGAGGGAARRPVAHRRLPRRRELVRSVARPAQAGK